MADKETVEFERDWISLAPVLAGASTLKEICELMWLKGRCAGMDAGMKHFAPIEKLIAEVDPTAAQFI